MKSLLGKLGVILFIGLAIFSLISILLLCYNAEAATKGFDVQFVVPAANELTDQVKSYGTRELRALHDVKLIDADPNLSAYFISIYPVPMKLIDGRDWAVVVSYVIEKDHIIDHGVLTGSPDQLKSLVEKIIAYFDTKWLEPKRHK
jgi:hypothetical protein